MTVEWLDVSDTDPRVAYVATAGQTTFIVPFAFLDEADLKVYVNDVLKTLSTDYTTTGEADDDGGTVVFNTGLTVSDSVVIVRDVTVEIATHIPPSGPLDIPALNLTFSRMVMMLQKVVGLFPRCLQQPDSDVADLGPIPVVSDRASKYLAFDAEGQPIVASAVSASVPVTAAAATILDDTTTAAMLATLGLIGVAWPYTGTTAPSGTVLGQGQALSRTTYAALWTWAQANARVVTDAAWATDTGAYSSGDGSTTFRIPQLGGRVVAGRETSASLLTTAGSGIDGDTLGATGGTQTHTLTPAQVGTININLVADDGDAATGANTSLGGGSIGGVTIANGVASGEAQITSSSSSAHLNTQPTIVLNYIIVTGPTA